MTAPSLKLIELAETLDTLCKKRVTGELHLKHPSGDGKLHLLSGRLLFAIAPTHRIRRWYRALHQHCPQWTPDLSQKLNDALWEYQLLYDGIMKKQITVTEAKSVIRSIAKEVFFDLGSNQECRLNLVEGPPSDTELVLSLSVSYLEFEPDLMEAAKLYRQWLTAGFSKLSPTFAPVLKQKVDPQHLSGLHNYLNGHLTLWDIAQKTHQSIYKVTFLLLPLVKKRLIQFRNIPDLSVAIPPHPEETPKQTLTSQYLENQIVLPVKKGLIACVDDSPLIAETIRKIVEPFGYEILSIEEPMRGFAQLLESKPDLIFLDLIMPTANGYSVCKFLRKTSIFEKTPIIILTSRDTLLDRNRAKLVGASDFLGKPPDPEKTIQMIHKYLKSETDEHRDASFFSKELPGLVF
jgi:chemotaxis family two-component system response regulator PixG